MTRHDFALGRCLVEAISAQLPTEVLDGIGDVKRRAIDARRSRARSSSWPAGPTNGLPDKSSWSPGCSPTSITRADAAPSPHTARVAFAHSGHARHPDTAALSCFSDVAALAVSLSTAMQHRPPPARQVSGKRVGRFYRRLKLWRVALLSRGPWLEALRPPRDT